MNKKSFTLVEVIASVTIVIILASVSLGVFNQIVSNTRLNICRQNQIIILNALKLYIYNNNAVPATLSKLPARYCDSAIAYLKKNEPGALAMRKIYLALLRLDRTNNEVAFAADFSDDVGNKKVFKCPQKTGGGLSYAYNDSLKTALNKMDSLKILETADFPVICDSDNATFVTDAGGNITTGLALRHKSSAIAASKESTCLVNNTYNWSGPKKRWKHIKHGTDNSGSHD